jgi:hypothetical protein
MSVKEKHSRGRPRSRWKQVRKDFTQREEIREEEEE